MRTSIRLIIIILLFSYTCNSHAQIFGIKAGYNSSNMVFEESETGFPYQTVSYNNNYKMKSGFNVGASLEFPVLNWLTLGTGIVFNTKGYKNSYEDNTFDTTITVNESYDLYYLDIPLNAKFPFTVKGLTFYGSIGGYAGMGLSGKTKADVTYGSLSESTDKNVEWGSEPGTSDFKSLDYGVSVGAGMEFKSFQVGVTYNYGLANISPNSDNGDLINNRVVGISVGYLFGTSKKSKQGKTSPAYVQEQSIPGKVEESKKDSKEKSDEVKAAEIEKQLMQKEKIRTDSIAEIRAEEERIRAEKAVSDSIETARILAANLEAEKARLAKIQADSIAASQNAVVYRVQFASNTSKKGSYEITIGGNKYNTWEYLFSGAYRSTVGEFKTLAEATAFQKTVRQSGYSQAFVVAFKNNTRTTDPALFK